MFFFKIREQRGRSGSVLRQWGERRRERGKVAQIMYIYVSKCKNDIK
jgi:hypothetical protein